MYTEQLKKSVEAIDKSVKSLSIASVALLPLILGALFYKYTLGWKMATFDVALMFITFVAGAILGFAAALDNLSREILKSIDRIEQKSKFYH